MTPIAAEPDISQSTPLAKWAAGISIAVHVAAAALALGYTGADLFASDPEAVAVTLVTPDEVKPDESPPEPPAEEKLDLRPTTQDLKEPPQQTPPPPQQPPQQQATAPVQSPSQPSKAQPAPKQQQATAQPAYVQPQPDISLRYQVDLGLKPLPPLPTPAAAPEKGGAEFGDAASAKADIDGSSIQAFRNRLKDCAPLPAAVAPDDKVVIVLRATMTPDAKLAATPVLMEATASPSKGLALMQAAIAALQACQPYAMLPVDKYSEWRTLDLRFTPQDFRKG